MAQPGQTQYNTFPQYQAQGYAAPTGYATPTGYSPTNEPYTAPYGFGASYTFNDSQPGTQPAASQSTELPDSTSVDATVATQAIERLVAAQLRVEGFRKADSIAMKRLELEVIAYVAELYKSAKEYANLANRSRPITTDLICVCDDRGIRTADLRRAAARRPKKRRKGWVPRPPPHPTELLVPEPAPEVPPMLSPQDEGAAPLMPATLRTLQQPLPPLPPIHTYVRTTLEPPKKAALPSLQKKLKTASLVQGSLKNLLVKTTPVAKDQFTELLGQAVNYEANIFPRKRWKVSKPGNSEEALESSIGV